MREKTNTFESQGIIPYTKLSSNSSLSIGREYVAVVPFPTKDGSKINNQFFQNSIGKDGIEQAVETLSEGMKKSAEIISMNIARGMERASKKRVKTANAYLGFFKTAFVAWFVVHVFGSENQLAVFVAVSLLVYALA